MHFSRHTHVVN